MELFSKVKNMQTAPPPKQTSKSKNLKFSNQSSNQKLQDADDDLNINEKLIMNKQDPFLAN